jgi:hypothetical protein
MDAFPALSKWVVRVWRVRSRRDVYMLQCNNRTYQLSNKAATSQLRELLMFIRAASPPL